ncbi:MAG: acyl-CoA desaturase [Chloroflexota bacterium]
MTMVIAPATAGQAAHAEPGAHDYADLKALVKAAGLLDKQPLYYTAKITATVGLFAGGVAALLAFDAFWARALVAVYLAVVCAQLGFIGHDTGHRQVCARGTANDLLGLVFATLFLGMSVGWWREKHNAHHAHPNHLEMDPDIDIPMLAFSPAAAARATGITRVMVQYQAFLFYPFLLLAAVDFQLSSLRYQFRPGSHRRGAEPLVLAAHHLLYTGGLIWLLGGWGGVGFIVLHQAVFGLLMGSVFAPNHKGMLLMDEESGLDFMRAQVLTARNVRSTPLTDFWYGGLHLQIEHHLFPSMARNKLKQAHLITRAFCRERGIAYHETGVVQAQREILHYLHTLGAPLRAARG